MKIRISVRGLRERNVSTESRLPGLPIVSTDLLSAAGAALGRA
jgi:hypothetical protein